MVFNLSDEAELGNDRDNNFGRGRSSGWGAGELRLPLPGPGSGFIPRFISVILNRGFAKRLLGGPRKILNSFNINYDF